MSFLFPAMLAGLAGLAVPIALHLIARHRFPVQEFPSIRLLRKDLRTNVFAPRLVDVPQLILRLLVLTLLVVAMARLFSSGGSGSTEAPRNLVLVIDCSAGMRMQVLDETTKQKTTFIEIARQEARTMLEKLNASSQCSVILAADTSKVLSPLQHDKDSALKALEQLATVDGTGCGLVRSIADGCELVAGRREAASQVVVFTDMRANAFTSRDQKDLKRIERVRQNMGAALQMVCVDLSAQRELSNLGIVEARVRGQNARVGDDAHIITRVFNSSTQAKTARLGLQVGDRKEPVNKEIMLEPGAEAVVDLTANIQRASNTVATARIADDELNFDDTFSVPLNINDTRRVLIVNGGGQSATETKASDLVKLGAAPASNAGSDEGQLDGATILRYVINPGRELGAAHGTGIDVTVVAPDALGGQTLSKYDMIAMYDVSSLPDSVLEDITTYVTEGRSVLLICSGSTQALNFNRVLAAGSAKRPALSPAVIGNDKVLDQPVDIQQTNNAHPLLTPFQDRLKGDLSVIRFTKLREIQSLSEGASAILNTTSGMPLALEHAVGRGKVALLTFGFELDRGNIARARSFPSLIWRITDYLTGRLRQRPADVIKALSPAVLDVSEPAFLFVNELDLNPEARKPMGAPPVTPDPKAEPKESQKDAPKADAPASVRLTSNPDKTALMPGLPAGRYQLSKAAQPNETLRVGYSRYVTTFIDPLESDTKRQPDAELPKLLSGEARIIPIKETSTLSLPGDEHWKPLVLFLALAYLAEALLGYVLTKRKERQRIEEQTA